MFSRSFVLWLWGASQRTHLTHFQGWFCWRRSSQHVKSKKMSSLYGCMVFGQSCEWIIICSLPLQSGMLIIMIWHYFILFMAWTPRNSKKSKIFSLVSRFHTRSSRFGHLIIRVLNKCYAILEKRQMICINDAWSKSIFVAQAVKIGDLCFLVAFKMRLMFLALQWIPAGRGVLTAVVVWDGNLTTSQLGETKNCAILNGRMLTYVVTW